MGLPAGIVGGLIDESNKMSKISYRGTPCVFEGLGEGVYYMVIAKEQQNRRYFAYQGGIFTDPFGKAWFSDIFSLSYTSEQGITVTQTSYDSINIMICRIG